MGGIPTDESYGGVFLFYSKKTVVSNFLHFYSGYKGQDGYCHAHDPNITLVAPIKGWVNVTSGDQNAMKVALLQHGPISVAIDASQKTFSFYSNGVYYDPKWLVYKWTQCKRCKM